MLSPTLHNAWPPIPSVASHSSRCHLSFHSYLAGRKRAIQQIGSVAVYCVMWATACCSPWVASTPPFLQVVNLCIFFSPQLLHEPQRKGNSAFLEQETHYWHLTSGHSIFKTACAWEASKIAIPSSFCPSHLAM